MPLATRILIGVTILGTLAVVDIARNGRRATRWREYAFLVFCTVVAMVYGAINDQITSRVSWEYFYYGKELASVLGPQTPPDVTAMSWQVARVGMSATWSAGLLIGAVLLIANNPRKGRPRLPYRSMATLLLVVLGITVICSAIVAIVGYLGGLTWMSADFREMAETNLWRPYRFMCTYGEHLGGYVGGLVGLTTAVVLVVRRRRLLPLPSGEGSG
jgi:hypothetical protein